MEDAKEDDGVDDEVLVIVAPEIDLPPTSIMMRDDLPDELPLCAERETAGSNSHEAPGHDVDTCSRRLPAQAIAKHSRHGLARDVRRQPPPRERSCCEELIHSHLASHLLEDLLVARQDI